MLCGPPSCSELFFNGFPRQYVPTAAACVVLSSFGFIAVDSVLKNRRLHHLQHPTIWAVGWVFQCVGYQFGTSNRGVCPPSYSSCGASVPTGLSVIVVLVCSLGSRLTARNKSFRVWIIRHCQDEKLFVSLSFFLTEHPMPLQFTPSLKGWDCACFTLNSTNIRQINFCLKGKLLLCQLIFSWR